MTEHGIRISNTAKLYPYRIAFDFERYIDALKEPVTTNKQKMLSKLVPASVSLCSNVPGCSSPVCFVSKCNSMLLVEHIYRYIITVGMENERLLKLRFSHLSEQFALKQAEYESAQVPYAERSLQELKQIISKSWQDWLSYRC